MVKSLPIQALTFIRKRAIGVHMFASREDAGRKLAQLLKSEGITADIVAGLPRGGVIVAAEVARSLGLPLEVVIVRKIGHPLHREFAVGAMAEGEVVLLDEKVLNRTPLIRAELERIIEEEQDRLHSYEEKFHGRHTADFTDKAVLLVDDGLATGATTEAAVLSLRNRGARRIVVAVPVASTGAVDRLLRVADRIEALIVDPDFDAVGRYYDVFSQTTDEEVLESLNAGNRNS